MTRQELRVLLDAQFCGCGAPGDAAAAILRLLRLHERGDNSETTWRAQRKEIEEWLPDDGVRFLLMYWLDRLELTEHGGSVEGAWLTEKGGAVLEALAREEEDDFEALFAEHCVHGFDVGDNDDTSHTCT